MPDLVISAERGDDLVMLDFLFYGFELAPGNPLAAPIGSGTPMRLRISELDYYPFRSAGVPPAIDTSFRRPFVALIPL
jgi:hypothetical protein